MPEPILWTQHAKPLRSRPVRQFNPESGEVEFVINEDTGEPLLERIPQVGHDGGYDDPKKFKRYGFVNLLRHDGHQVFAKLTNAAAQTDLNASYVHFMRAKHSYFGWFPVGQCPLSALAAGTIQKKHIAAKDILKDRPCDRAACNEFKPCKHYIAERDARRARHAKAEKKRIESFKDDSVKMLEAQQKQTTDIVEGIGDKFSEALRGFVAPADEKKK